MNKRNLILAAGAAIVALAAWLLLTDNAMVWPVRNTLQYHLLAWLTGPITEPPAASPAGTLAGRITDAQGEPLAGAWVLVAHRSGVTWHQRTDAAGQYRLEGIAPGTYRPVVGAPGFESARFGQGWGQTVDIAAHQITVADAALWPLAPSTSAPATDLRLSAPQEIECPQPLPSRAIRREVFFNSGGQANQPTFYYTPVETTAASDWPLLLAIYPGPADSWSAPACRWPRLASPCWRLARPTPLNWKPIWMSNRACWIWPAAATFPPPPGGPSPCWAAVTAACTCSGCCSAVRKI
jgi:hypothetical protein